MDNLTTIPGTLTTSNITPLFVTNSTPIYVTPIKNVDLALSVVFSVLSILGAILIFVTFCARNIFNPENETRRLLLYLTFADFVVAFGNLLGTVRYIIVYRYNIALEPQTQDNGLCERTADSVCLVQSFITTVGNMWSYFWNTAIAIHLCIALIYYQTGTHSCKTKVFTLIVCWVIPLVISIAATSNNILGEDFAQGTGAWCWISLCLPTEEKILWMLFCGKGWEIMWYLITCVTFIWLKGYMWKQRRRFNRRTFNDVSQRLRAGDVNYLYLWLVGYLCRIWGTLRFFVFLRNTDADYYLMPLNTADTWFLHIQSIGGSAQALCTCILFCFIDTSGRQALFSKICRRRHNEEDLAILADDDHQRINYVR